MLTNIYGEKVMFTKNLILNTFLLGEYIWQNSNLKYFFIERVHLTEM